MVKVKGEGVTEAEANAFDSAAGNIAVVADGTDTLTIKLNKNVKGLNTVETKTIQLGDPAGNHTTIKLRRRPHYVHDAGYDAGCNTGLYGNA